MGVHVQLLFGRGGGGGGFSGLFWCQFLKNSEPNCLTPLTCYIITLSSAWILRRFNFRWISAYVH